MDGLECFNDPKEVHLLKALLHLNCPECGKALHSANLHGFDSAYARSLLASEVMDCRHRITKKGIELTAVIEESK